MSTRKTIVTGGINLWLHGNRCWGRILQSFHCVSVRTGEPDGWIKFFKAWQAKRFWFLSVFFPSGLCSTQISCLLIKQVRVKWYIINLRSGLQRAVEDLIGSKVRRSRVDQGLNKTWVDRDVDQNLLLQV